MNKSWIYLTTFLAIASTGLHADTEDDDLGSEQILEPQQQENPGAFSFGGSGDYVSKTKLHNSRVSGTELTFYIWNAKGSAIFYYDPICEEGAQLALGYENAHFDWSHNPYFSQKNFGEINLALGGFTKRIPNWIWQAQVTMNMDTEHRNWNLYTNYDLLLWGRYNTGYDNINLHVGFWMQTGMKIDHIYPILGFDWKYSDDWKISVVFPMNISVLYTIDENWSLTAAGRFFDIRRRVGRDQPLSEGLFQYHNAGAEIGANYQLCNWLKANAHVGYTFWGKLRVSDRENRHPTHFDIDSSWYAGGMVSTEF